MERGPRRALGRCRARDLRSPRRAPAGAPRRVGGAPWPVEPRPACGRREIPRRREPGPPVGPPA
eukprot:1665731-Pyramimonas_sp.AAC.1